jgi:hypothetical protein
VILPVVHVADPAGAAPSIADVGTITLPEMPAPLPFTVQALGGSASGGTEPMVDAQVSLTTVLADDPGLRVIYRVTGTVDAEGDVLLALVPGSTDTPRAYLLDVLPGPESPHAQRWSQPLEVRQASGSLDLPVAPLRVLVTGTLLDENGVPAQGVAVRTRPTDEVQAVITAEPAIRQNEVRWPETQTGPDGRFSLWLDASVLGIPTGYVVSFEPPSGSLLPRTTLLDVFPHPDAAGRHRLGEVSLPEAAYVRGTPEDADGAPVPGMIVRVYERVMKSCATGPCQPPALLRATGTAADDGRVRLVLPRL